MATNEEDVKILFTNGIINKRQLKNLMYSTFHNYGVVKSSIIAPLREIDPIILLFSN